MAVKTGTLWKDRKHFMWWPLSFQTYEIRNDRLYQSKGLFSTTYDELLLYRITDMTLKQTFWQRIFGTGTILLATRGDSDAVIRLENIAHPHKVRDLFSQQVEQARIHYNVVGREFVGHSHHTDEPDDYHAHDDHFPSPHQDDYF